MLGNFRQALAEVFSFRKREVVSAEGSGSADKGEKPPVVKKPSETSSVVEKGKEESLNGFNGKTKEDKGRSTVPKSVTTIGINTTINGSILSEAEVFVAGTVIGDIESHSLTYATGLVKGNIKCKAADIDGAKIEGGINAADRIIIRNGSVIQGDLVANNGVISGEVRGKIYFDSEVSIEKEAVIIGDIFTKSISVEKGAMIKGSMSINYEDLK
jgi:cytoskeletal protein CcmA (bactofilin family)